MWHPWAVHDLQNCSRSTVGSLGPILAMAPSPLPIPSLPTLQPTSEEQDSLTLLQKAHCPLTLIIVQVMKKGTWPPLSVAPPPHPQHAVGQRMTYTSKELSWIPITSSRFQKLGKTGTFPLNAACFLRKFRWQSLILYHAFSTTLHFLRGVHIISNICTMDMKVDILS